MIGRMALGVFCLGFCLAAGGCGADGESPSTVVNKYHQAIMDKNMDAIKAVAAPDADLGKIKALLDFRSNALKTHGLPKVLSEKITGDKAVVRCKFGPTEQNVDLRKVNGEWKVE